MRKGWEYKRLDECANIEYGTRVVQKKDSGTLYPVYGGGGETFRMDKFNREDCLIVARFAMSRRCVRFVNGKFFLNDSGLSVKAGDKLYQSYLNYNIISLNDDIYHLGKGAAQRNLDVKSFKKLTIAIPPLSTQLAIVSELDKINELIRLKKEQLKDFDHLAQSLFYEMFGEGKCLRKKLKDIVKIQSGQVSPLEEPYSEMIHIGPANIESNTGRLLNLKTAKEENLISGKYLFNSSMVLYSKIRPNLNKVTIPSFEGICSADMYPIIPLECIDKNFLLFLLKQKEFLTYAISNSGRANIPKINREALLNYKAILPPLPLQRLFAQRIEQIEREKSEVQKSIQDLETLLASHMQYWFE